MHPIAQLDQLRRHMAEELTQIPEYRALKIMERFIAEMSAIYDSKKDDEQPQADDTERKFAQAIETHLKGDASPSIVRNAAYLPVHRVA